MAAGNDLITLKSRALVTYLTVGDPSLEASEQIMLAAIDAGADVIELGVPFSDPVADGPVIQRASERALGNRVQLKDVIELAARIKKSRSQAKLIIFSYLNPLLRFGLASFAQAARTAGINGVLVTDLIPEEAQDYLRNMRAQRLHTIFLAAPTSTDDRLRQIAKCSTGFVYAVSRTGVTGVDQQADIQGEVQKLVKRIRRFTKLPVAVGFGISKPEHFRDVTRFADAAVVGSAIVRTIEQGPAEAANAVSALIAKLKG